MVPATLKFPPWHRLQFQEYNPPVAASCSLAFRAAEEPDKIVMHCRMIRPEPFDERLDVELCRLAAHWMRAVDIDGFTGGQDVGEGLGHGDLR